MTKHIFILAFLSLVLFGCGASKTGSSTDTSDTPAPTNGSIVTTPGTSPIATVTAPLNLQIYTQYDTTQGLEYQTFVEPNSVSCVSTAATPNVTCTLNIQEGRLYYSSLNFQIAWNPSACKILIFQPYFYHAYDQDGFFPPWSKDQSINCSTAGGNKPPSNCWGGAAPNIGLDFPNKGAFIYLTDESKPPGSQSASAKVPSAFSLNYGSNRLTTNDMSLAKRNAHINYNYYNAGAFVNPDASMVGAYGGNDSYIANSFTDYSLICVDDYYDPLPYVINLNINDVNSAPTNPVLNYFKTWIDL